MKVGRIGFRICRTFARAVIGREIAAGTPRDDRVYDLDSFLDPGFLFQPRSELGIARAEVRQMDVRVRFAHAELVQPYGRPPGSPDSAHA